MKATRRAKVSETLKRIHELEAERRQLFRRAGEGGMTPEELERLQRIERQLAGLWEERRRERAGRPDELYPLIEGRWERAA